MLLRFQRLTPACWTEGLEAAIARPGAEGCLYRIYLSKSLTPLHAELKNTLMARSIEVHMDGELRCRM
jgi:hypothetical protein